MLIKIDHFQSFDRFGQIGLPGNYQWQLNILKNSQVGQEVIELEYKTDLLICGSRSCQHIIHLCG